MNYLENQEFVNNSFLRDDLPESVEIIGISFRGSTKVYYFASNGNIAKLGDNAIVETARGLEYGKVTLANSFVKREALVLPLKNVIRIADKNDDLRYEANREKEKEAFDICAKKILEHKLDMKLIDVEYTFDNTKLLFYFTSDDRVDFRELVKDLASYFRTRIELRQIGIRDEAKIMGGLGICGRPFCCNTFLPDFVQVSIKMAKEQNLSLNSAKISGACGRLMCCLRYEYDTYQEETRRMPRVDTVLLTPDGVGTVTEIKPLQNTVKVVLQNDNEKTPRVYHLSVLKPYEGGEAVDTAAGTDKKPQKPSAQNADDAKKEPKNKRESQNRNQKPKNAQGSGTSQNPEVNGAESESEAQTTSQASAGGQNKNKNSNGGHNNHHSQRRNKGNGKPASGQGSAASDKGQNPSQTSNAQQNKPNNDPKAQPQKAPANKPDTVPNGQDSGKRSFAPLPSNSIKRGQGGRFGGVKTRPGAFNKKDNSEKK